MRTVCRRGAGEGARAPAPLASPAPSASSRFGGHHTLSTFAAISDTTHAELLVGLPTLGARYDQSFSARLWRHVVITTLCLPGTTRATESGAGGAEYGQAICGEDLPTQCGLGTQKEYTLQGEGQG